MHKINEKIEVTILDSFRRFTIYKLCDFYGLKFSNKHDKYIQKIVPKKFHEPHDHPCEYCVASGRVLPGHLSKKAFLQKTITIYKTISHPGRFLQPTFYELWNIHTLKKPLIHERYDISKINKTRQQWEFGNNHCSICQQNIDNGDGDIGFKIFNGFRLLPHKHKNELNEIEAKYLLQYYKKNAK